MRLRLPPPLLLLLSLWPLLPLWHPQSAIHLHLILCLLDSMLDRLFRLPLLRLRLRLHRGLHLGLSLLRSHACNALVALW